jgi:hypothetical protein
MNVEEFEQCKEIANYSEFMQAALKYDNLTMENYEKFMPNVFEVVLQRKEKDPVLMFEKIIDELGKLWNASDQLPFHGPWHHGIVPSVIIMALKNNGYNFTEENVKEALQRGLRIPAGACGFHGVCGAGTGLGVAMSIIARSTPFHDNERSQAITAAVKAIERIGKLGGPRCCRLSAYTVLGLAVKLLKKMGYELPEQKMAGRCAVHHLNAQCHEIRCPYYPRAKNE